ncbi:MAG: DNA polymerase IV [Spirochaetaceae bacterium]|jgi:DNA polymerase-4|nr:DNA polymerase IV [Spirochaetaceae bacterium]
MGYFLHADLDAFYAAVEQLDNRRYRGKPVIVGGVPGDRRAVVSTASYEARKYGVRSAMPIASAYGLCPDGIFLRGNMKRYKEKSREVMDAFSQFTPNLTQISIDEAFLDIEGTGRLFGPPSALAGKLKDAVREKTGLTVSVGMASNKYVAKIASGMSKPDGCFIVEKGAEEDFMMSLPVDKIWGAGGKTQALFRKYGYRTCADIHRIDEKSLCSLFGKAFGTFLYRAVRGEAAAEFDGTRGSRSIRAEHTFEFDVYDESVIETELMNICDRLTRRLLDSRRQSGTVTVKIRYTDFSTESARETSGRPVSAMNDLFGRVSALFRRKYKTGSGVRLIGAGLMNLCESAGGGLFDFEDERSKKLERCIHEINSKFPEAALKKARLVKPPARSGYGEAAPPADIKHAEAVRQPVATDVLAPSATNS